jgi:hypothetical protein
MSLDLQEIPSIPLNKIEEWKEQAKNTIDTIYELYKNDPYMISKTNHYINRQLPFILENIKQTHISNQQRIEDLCFEQEQFMYSFLNRNRYFHVANTEKYFVYDGLHYMETNEENMLYIILTSIRHEQNPKLLSWKDKTKVSLLKRIKEIHLTQSIPESQTIQMVLNILYPAIFQNKKECKFFLSILGDNIFKKNQSLIHFINPIMKTFLRECNQIALSCFGTQCIQTFKTKCHDKHYEFDNKNCRLVRIQESCKNDLLTNLTPYMLDILCVACHYSIRYENADIYVINFCNDIEITDYIFKLTYTSPEILIDTFISEYLFVVDTNTSIENSEKGEKMEQIKDKMNWQNMMYLWKQFLYANQLPLTLFQTLFKNILTQTKFSTYYKLDGDYFIGIGSSQWPMIQTFLRFWGETMIYDENEMELEIEEITNLFRYWGENIRTYKWEVFSLTEYQILDVISYFFPNIEIDKQKYIYNTRSTLWDKSADIQTALIAFKEHIYQSTDSNVTNVLHLSSFKPPSPMVQLYREANEESSADCASNMRKGVILRNKTPIIISIYDIYSFYCRFFSSKLSQPKLFLVSKSYFEKYLMEHYSEYVCENGTLSSEWLDIE